MVGVVLLRPSRAGKSGNGPHAAHGPRVAQPCSTKSPMDWWPMGQTQAQHGPEIKMVGHICRLS